jgi:hypothetical protein
LDSSIFLDRTVMSFKWWPENCQTTYFSFRTYRKRDPKAPVESISTYQEGIHSGLEWKTTLFDMWMLARVRASSDKRRFSNIHEEIICYIEGHSSSIL